MGVGGLPQFIAAIDRAVAAMKDLHFEDEVAIVEFSLERLVEYSPTKTGAYRASHTVWEGSEAPTLQLWEPANIPDRNPGGKALSIDVPNIADAGPAVRLSAAPFSRLWLLNGVLPFEPGKDISYASNVEFGGRWGNSFVPPHMVYDRAFQDAVGFAERLASTAQARLEARS